MQHDVAHQVEHGGRVVNQAAGIHIRGAGAKSRSGIQARAERIHFRGDLGAGALFSALAEHSGGERCEARKVRRIGKLPGFYRHRKCNRGKFVVFEQHKRQPILQFHDGRLRKLNAQDFLAHRRAVQPLHFADVGGFILREGDSRAAADYRDQHERFDWAFDRVRDSHCATFFVPDGSCEAGSVITMAR